MALNSLQPHLAVAVLDNGPDGLRSAACPMCHTPAPLTGSALEAGGEWRCVTCGQHWDASRLAAAAAYAAWFVERAAGPDGSGHTPLSQNPPSGELGGHA